VAKKKKHEEEPENLERWLLTYADLITLLLGLFVISVLHVADRQDEYQDFASALTRQFGSKTVLAGNKGVLFTPSTKTGRAQSPQFSAKSSTRKKKIVKQLVLQFREQLQAGKMEIRETRDGVAINLPEKLLFETGKAEIRPMPGRRSTASPFFLIPFRIRCVSKATPTTFPSIPISSPPTGTFRLREE